MNTEVMFSSASDEWSTPRDFLANLKSKGFDFSWDLAASEENTVCSFYFNKEQDSLQREWHLLSGWLWLNPPYSRCKEFMEKAYSEMQKGAKIIALLPTRTDTKWFHDYIYRKDGVDIQFIKGRLKFGNSVNSAPFPSMLVYFYA